MNDGAVKISADSRESAFDAMFLACALTTLLAEALPNYERLDSATAGAAAGLANRFVWAARDWFEQNEARS